MQPGTEEPLDQPIEYTHAVGVSEKPRATYDDLTKLPENVVGEIIDGVL